MKPTYEELERKIAVLDLQLNLSLAAERAWETTMMHACGEDGPKSVADKFAELQAKCAALAADNEKAMEAMRQADAAVKLAHEKFSALAAENAGLKAAFDKPQAYLSWHTIPPTWEDPLPCGEYLDVHDDAGHKNSDGTDCWPVYAKPEINTQATDAFLAEVRAQESKRVYESILDNPAVTDMASLVDWLEQNANDSVAFAAQLRKGAAL